MSDVSPKSGGLRSWTREIVLGVVVAVISAVVIARLGIGNVQEAPAGPPTAPPTTPPLPPTPTRHEGQALVTFSYGGMIVVPDSPVEFYLDGNLLVVGSVGNGFRVRQEVDPAVAHDMEIKFPKEWRPWAGNSIPYKLKIPDAGVYEVEFSKDFVSGGISSAYALKPQ